MTLCSICNAAKAQKDGYCKRCRLREGFCRRKYWWTEQQIALLKEAYELQSRVEMMQRITRIVELTGFPRSSVVKEARRRGWGRKVTIWSEDEKNFIREHAGEMSVSDMARKLGRGIDTTRVMARKIGFDVRVRLGYDQKELAQALGCSPNSVRKWTALGWLRVINGRIHESTVRKFLYEHSEQYELRRVDEIWFKSMVFPKFGLELLPARKKHTKVA